MIQIRDLSIWYGQIKALKSVNLKIDAGQWVLITGASGCGKSTLAKSISGIIPQSMPAHINGSILVDGKDPSTLQLSEFAQTAGMVFQNPGTQLFHLRVEDEIAFGPRNLGFDEKSVVERVEWAIKATGLEELRGQKPMYLSGGQKQCVAIASLLAMRPQVLVLDEPTASLDLPNTKKVMITLNQLRIQYGITIVMIEHRLTSVLEYVNRVIIMEKGEIIDDGLPHKVLNNFERRNELGLRRPAKQPMSPWKQLIRPHQNGPNMKYPVLELENIYAGYEKNNVLKDISLSIYPGDFIALVGNNGVGKSTLSMVMAGIMKPNKGRIKFDGVYCKPNPGKDVSLLFQDAAAQLLTDSVDEEVSFGPQNYDCFLEEKHIKTLAEADLMTLRRRPINALSIGQQQRTALAACISLCPRLIILDEPTLGQDWGHLQQMMNYLCRLNEQGAAVVLISHDYKLVHHYANRIYLLEDGKIKLKGKVNPKNITQGEKNEI
ncbi:MAG: ATP-binding cassette domain-containing protein [Anaerolineaceae bacterium]|nr:ATP-binding cassette domain-containing protein [Anaerolineaceae bacterium]